MNIPIVIVAYNRGEPLKRLLNSIKVAHYDKEDIDLIISIDKGENESVCEIAEEFTWDHGNKIILKQKKNLGLRKHVLKCGDLTKKYDAIIMLEDDLLVSKSFYKFAIQSVKFYMNDKNIGGISLYNYRISEFANHRTFIPMQDSSDIFFMNVPSSWGQIWTREQWNLFREWYNKKNYEGIDFQTLIPEVSINWKESSWKKYFYMYIAHQRKYIVYPRIGLSTNMGDIGTHARIVSTDYQSILMNEFDRNYVFKKLDESNCVYDAFFENERIAEDLNLKEELTVDYYGLKPSANHKSYLLSTRKLNYKILNKWGLSLKPYELNVIYNIKGEELFLYDRNHEQSNFQNHKIQDVMLIKYESPGLTRHKALCIALYDYKEAFKRKSKAVIQKITSSLQRN